jgi:hypothetical protein
MSPVDYWEDIAQITYDLSSDDNDKVNQRKRSNSSTSSRRSSSSRSTDDHQRRKRKKSSSPMKSRTDDIELITLSSSENSDIDDQLS